MTAPLDPRTGLTARGLPVSRNRAPARSLARHAARLFVTIIDQPDDATTTDFLLNETAFVRVLERGHWEAQVASDKWRRFDRAVLFGAQSEPLHVRVTGPMAVAGFAIRPAAWPALFDAAAPDHADRIVALADVAPALDAAMVAAAADIDAHDATLDAIEAALAEHLAMRGTPPANTAMAAFELIARNDPTRRVAAAARQLGLPLHAFDRQVRRHFGHSAKIVLRRARFLDMAAVMRGLAVPDADELAALRFYDQSHLNREFRLFTGMTPLAFERAATPLLTPGIEARQHRKFDDLAALAPGERPPWLA